MPADSGLRTLLEAHSPAEDSAVFDRLAKLSRVEYDRVRDGSCSTPTHQ
jgi:hypothetical protein